jgi:hypothetical protein
MATVDSSAALIAEAERRVPMRRFNAGVLEGRGLSLHAEMGQTILTNSADRSAKRRDVAGNQSSARSQCAQMNLNIGD